MVIVRRYISESDENANNPPTPTLNPEPGGDNVLQSGRPGAAWSLSPGVCRQPSLEPPWALAGPEGPVVLGFAPLRAAATVS